ncbi:MAG: single-stranded DNA-binding protein [Bacteroidetes bacterium]|nr:single-stranded DNA-binding protein [Bacteroidota bacterium]
MNTHLPNTQPRISPVIHNTAILSGNLSADPRPMALRDGTQIVCLTIVQHHMINGRKERYWFRIHIQGDMVNDVVSMLRKGDRAGFSGMLVSRNYVRDDNRMFHIMEMEAHEFWVEKKCSRPRTNEDMIELMD